MPGTLKRFEFLRATRLPLAALIAIEVAAIIIAVTLGFMAMHYQVLGRQHLAAYGYDTEIGPDGLREAMQYHEVIPGR